MSRSFKKNFFIFLSIILTILSVARIIYVNQEQHISKTHIYSIGKEFKYKEFEICVVETKIYNTNDMKEKYGEFSEEVSAENEIVIKLKVKNMTDQEKNFDVAPFTLQVGLENGGSMDPYIYPYLNPGLSGNFTLDKNGVQTVLLAFPVESKAIEEKEQMKLILSLYPNKYEIEL